MWCCDPSGGIPIPDTDFIYTLTYQVYAAKGWQEIKLSKLISVITLVKQIHSHDAPRTAQKKAQERVGGVRTDGQTRLVLWKIR